MDFKNKLQTYINMVNDELKKVFTAKSCPEESVYQAMEYSIMAGGKRLRPVLTLAVSDMLDGDMDDALRFGVAVEHIHTYSLIHDDLPCMDNDDLRKQYIELGKLRVEKFSITNTMTEIYKL